MPDNAQVSKVKMRKQKEAMIICLMIGVILAGSLFLGIDALAKRLAPPTVLGTIEYSVETGDSVARIRDQMVDAGLLSSNVSRKDFGYHLAKWNPEDIVLSSKYGEWDYYIESPHVVLDVPLLCLKGEESKFLPNVLELT